MAELDKEDLEKRLQQKQKLSRISDQVGYQES